MSSGQLPISVHGLRFRYGAGQFGLSVPALDIAGGTTAACIGPSGSGKTTLLHLMAGILLPTEGMVELGGVPWSDLTEAERRLRRIRQVGLVFQEFELLEHLSVRENILLPYYVQRSLALDDTAEATMRELAGAAGIDGLLARKPQALSQGERQRVAICRALVTRPAVVLADEPTGNLDPVTTGVVLELLLTQVRQRGATLVMVTHDHGLLGSFDRVIEFRTEGMGAVVG
jgi:putative ABC transport system ATP-binding protein